MTLIENASSVKHRDRSVSYIFDGPAAEGIDDGKPWRKRVKVTHSHDKDRRSYTTLVSECIAHNDGMFSVERFELHRDTMVMFASQPVARYGEKTFAAYCSSINDAIEEALDDNVESASRSALRRARDFVAAAVN